MALLVVALALLLAACGGAAEQATATPAATRAASTATPVAGATATATALAVATATPKPATSAGPKYGGTLRLYTRADPARWDPQKMTAGEIPLRVVEQAVFSRPVTLEWPTEGKCQFSILPDAGKSWRWLDDKTFEIALNQGIQFQNKPPVNGRELTAQDLVYSLKRMGEWQDVVQTFTKQIDKIEATDRYTARVSFNTPLPSFVFSYLGTYRGPIIVPAESLSGPDKDLSDPVKSWIGSGAFMFKSWTPGVKYTVERNPNFFKKGMPYVDGMDFIVMQDMATRMAALRGGKLDILTEAPVSDSLSLARSNPRMQVRRCPLYSGYIGLWMRTDKAPYNDVRVRRALSMAIDRNAIISSVLQGEGEVVGLLPSHLPLGMAVKDFPPETRKYLEYHPDDAKRLLQEAGFDKGLKVQFATSAIYGSPYNETFEAIKAMWDQVGIQTDLVWMERGAFVNKLTVEGDFPEIAFVRPGQSDPYLWLGRFNSKRSAKEENKSRVSDPALDKLLDEFQVSVDPKRQEELARQVQIRVADQVYAIMAINPMAFTLANPWVRDMGETGYVVFPQTMYERVWMDR